MSLPTDTDLANVLPCAASAADDSGEPPCKMLATETLVELSDADLKELGETAHEVTPADALDGPKAAEGETSAAAVSEGKPKGEPKESEGEPKESEAVSKESEGEAKESEGEVKESEVVSKESEVVSKESEVVSKESEGEDKESEGENTESEGEDKESEAKGLGAAVGCAALLAAGVQKDCACRF